MSPSVLFWIDHDGTAVICGKHRVEDLMIVPKKGDVVRVKAGGDWHEVVEVLHDIPARLTRVQLEVECKFLSNLP